MWKRIRQIFQKEEDPRVIIKKAIEAMNVSIEQSIPAIAQAKASQAEIQKKLNQYKADAERLQNDATRLVKIKKDQEAKQVLQQKNLIDTQVAQYEALNQNVLQTIYQLEHQQQAMLLKIDSYRTKEVMLHAKLDTAKTQADLLHQFADLQQKGDFNLDQLEADVNHLESTVSALHTLHTGEGTAEQLLANENIETLNENFDTLLKELEKEKEAEKRQKEENERKKLDLLFSQLNSTSEKTSETTTDKAKQIADFFDNKKDGDSKQKLLDDFFNS